MLKHNNINRLGGIFIYTKTDWPVYYCRMQSEKSAGDLLIHDVVIGGAGPVGLFLACELALAKCSVLILEKAGNPHSPLKQLPFGTYD
ncbi:MAG: hypothetical protein WB762_19040 [Candidatus Sulfotelmatobacter sp.]